MVGAMNTFANRGVYIKPIFITKIEDKNGNVIEYFDTEQVEAMDDVTAYKMIELMKGVVQSGTGVRLRYKSGLKNPIAGKTGTTNENRDAWFIGITPKLVAGAWVGAEDQTVTIGSRGEGSVMALPIVGDFLRRVHKDENINVNKTDKFLCPPSWQAVECEDAIAPTTEATNHDEFFE